MCTHTCPHIKLYPDVIMYAHPYTGTCKLTHVHRICECTCIYAHTYAYMHAHTYACTQFRECTYTNIHILAQSCTHVYLHAYRHTSHICWHAHIQTQTELQDNYQYILAESTLRTENSWKRLWRRQKMKIIRNMAHGYMKGKKRFLLNF